MHHALLIINDRSLIYQAVSWRSPKPMQSSSKAELSHTVMKAYIEEPADRRSSVLAGAAHMTRLSVSVSP